MYLPEIYRVFYPAVVQYTLFSASHETFSKRNYILGYKSSVNKCKKGEITPCILSDPIE
jgi:hypothetical protein